MGTIPIKEEKIHELRILKQYNNDGCKYVLNKTLKDKINKLSTKLNKSIAKNSSIYRVQVNTAKAQNDGGANRSVTGLHHLLVNYQ